MPKSFCPSTKDGTCPVLNGGSNSSMRFDAPSATHKFPSLSNARPCGWYNDFGFVPFSTCHDVKSFCPSTTDADLPIVNGGANSSTLSFPPSEAHRFPFGSNATKCGEENVLAVGFAEFDTKSSWPSTNDAFCEFENCEFEGTLSGMSGLNCGISTSCDGLELCTGSSEFKFVGPVKVLPESELALKVMSFIPADPESPTT